MSKPLTRQEQREVDILLKGDHVYGQCWASRTLFREVVRLRASLAAAEERLAKRDADYAECALSLADCAIERDKLTAALADERARYEALVGAVDPGPCPCCGDNIHAGHSLDCTFADDCPEEARAWDRVHEAIAANAVPAASLAAHDAGVLERAIEAVRGVRGLYEPNASGFKACELVEVALKAQALAAQAQEVTK